MHALIRETPRMLTESLSVAQQKATDHIKSLNPGQSLAFIFLSAPPSSLYRWVLALQRNYEAMTLNTDVRSPIRPDESSVRISTLVTILAICTLLIEICYCSTSSHEGNDRCD